MYQIELYVPLRDNAGQRIPRTCWTALEKKITATFRGFTRWTGVGSWQEQEEVVIVYRINVSPFDAGDAAECEQKTRLIAEYVKQTWKQSSVHWTVSLSQSHFT